MTLVLTISSLWGNLFVHDLHAMVGYDSCLVAQTLTIVGLDPGDPSTLNALGYPSVPHSRLALRQYHNVQANKWDPPLACKTTNSDVLWWK